jgi:hypothetical protein
VDVDVFAGGDRLLGHADRLAVLDDLCALRQVDEGDLVAERDRLGDGDLPPSVGSEHG